MAQALGGPGGTLSFDTPEDGLRALSLVEAPSARHTVVRALVGSNQRGVTAVPLAPRALRQLLLAGPLVRMLFVDRCYFWNVFL